MRQRKKKAAVCVSARAVPYLVTCLFVAPNGETHDAAPQSNGERLRIDRGFFMKRARMRLTIHPPSSSTRPSLGMIYGMGIHTAYHPLELPVSPVPKLNTLSHLQDDHLLLKDGLGRALSAPQTAGHEASTCSWTRI